jgi:hypothetical protein
MQDEKFKRTISLINDKYERYYVHKKEDSLKTLYNCHFGAIKLFYSEVEFLLKCSKYVNLDECLVLYIGAQPGYRLKHLFIKEYFPNIKMLLYDPLKFDIEEDEQIIIKSGKDGWFDDNKIEEVLKIANGRKIIYMSDIRISDDDFYKRELYIYEDLLKQQRWAINMGADFILLKFRLFFYQKDISEIDFINNDYVYTDNLIKDKIIFKKDDNLHNKNSYNMLYLSGKIYTQILQGARSTETRLFVKKIKYHKNIDNIVKYVNLPKESVENKYLFKYYSNDKYEGVLNNFNIYTRQKSFSSDINISKYIIGLEDDYTSKSIYYITKKWMKKNNKKINIDTIIELIIKTLTFFYKRYNNNLVICINKKLTANYYKNTNKPRDVDFDKSIYDDRKKIFFENLNKKMEYWNKQIKMLNTLNIDRFIINDYINSHKTQGQNYYDIKNNMFVRNYKNKK